MEIRIIGAVRALCVGEMFWRSVLLTQGLARAAGCSASAELKIRKPLGLSGSNCAELIVLMRNQRIGYILLLQGYKRVCDIKFEETPPKPRRVSLKKGCPFN